MDTIRMDIVNDCNSNNESNQQQEELLPNSTISSTDTISSCELLNHNLGPLECKNGVEGEKDFTFAWYNEVLIVLSMVLYVADIGTDINIAYNSYLTDRAHETIWPSLSKTPPAYTFIGKISFVFIILPSLVVSGISAKLYFLEMSRPTNCCYTRPSKALWTVRIICLFLFISPVERYCEKIWWGRRFRRAQIRGDQAGMHLSYANITIDDRELKYVRLFEAFLESAPQLIIQYLIVVKNLTLFGILVPIVSDQIKELYNIPNVISMATSTLSLTMALTTYKESFKVEPIRCYYLCDVTLKLPSGKFVALLFANISGICSRLIVIFCVITTIASDDKNVHRVGWIMLLIILIHCTCAALLLWAETIYHRFTFGTPWYRLRKRLMTIDDSDDGSFKVPYSLTLIEELLLDAVLAIVYFFTFLNTRSKWSRIHYITHYTLIFIENVGFIAYCYNNLEIIYLYESLVDGIDQAKEYLKFFGDSRRAFSSCTSAS